MIRPKNRSPKPAPKNSGPSLPAGVKVVKPPNSAARRSLLSGPDIQTSGGLRSAHSKPAKTR